MDLQTFISDRSRQVELAKACGTKPGYLWQIATRWRGRQAGIELAKRIEIESERIGPERVPKATLRPDVWGENDTAS